MAAGVILSTISPDYLTKERTDRHSTRMSPSTNSDAQTIDMEKLAQLLSVVGVPTEPWDFGGSVWSVRVARCEKDFARCHHSTIPNLASLSWTG